jgi:hypothetical protein
METMKVRKAGRKSKIRQRVLFPAVVQVVEDDQSGRGKDTVAERALARSSSMPSFL